MTVGTKGTLTYKDNTTAMVELLHKTTSTEGKETFWFAYEKDEEDNKQIKCISSYDKRAVFPLPKQLIPQVFVANEDKPVAEDDIDDLGAQMASKGNVPKGFEDCTKLYSANPKGQGLYKVYIGYNPSTNSFHISFGLNNIMTVSKERMLFMMTSFSSLSVNSLISQGENLEKIQESCGEIAKDSDFNIMDIKKGKLYEPKQKLIRGDADDIKSAINQDELQELEGDTSSDKKSSAEQDLQEVKALQEDFEEYTKSMTEEEKHLYENELSKKQEEALEEQTSSFEKELLGSIESEEDKEYNFEYFFNIHKTQGSAALKEELSKLSKEDREPMIIKIKEEYKQIKLSKTQSNDTDTEEDKE
jgi:hypothetical protein